jgi:hypothetical protein
MSDKPTDIDTDTSDPSPPLLFCRSEPVPGDSDDEAIEILEEWRRSSMILAPQPALSVVNLSALAERIERAIRADLDFRHPGADLVGEPIRDHEEIRRIWKGMDDEARRLDPVRGRAERRLARVEFIVKLLREVLGGH